jgi:hypothetical protein
VRLDDELAAMEGRFRVADFNACPVAREHDAPRISARIFDDDLGLRDVDALAIEPSLHIRAQRPAEQRHFRTGEGQYGPESERGRDARDAKRTETNAAEEHERTTRAE